ncbi:MAG: alpha/beta hydrolase [Dehalococcoidia bacterium]
MASDELGTVLALIKEMELPALEKGGAADVASLRNVLEMDTSPLPEGTSRIEVSGPVRGEWLATQGCDPDRRLLYLHGGGYVAGSPASHRQMAGRLAAVGGCAVLLIDYGLAPEKRFPVAVDDAVAAWEWMLANGPNGGVSAVNAFVAGDSAGGGLTLALLLALRDRGLRMPDAACAISPWADLTMSGASMETRAGRDPMVQREFLNWMADLYLDGASPREPLASPLFGDFKGLPPLLIQVGDDEVLLDDSVRVAENAKAAGVEVELEVWPEMIHVWHAFWPILPEAREALDGMAAFIKKHSAVAAQAGV